VRLQQILTNLVGNAVKFTSHGSIRILVTALRHPEGSLCFEVRDSGIGMDPESLEHIFEPFHQADTSISTRFGGTGLGLTLSREIAQQMGGELRVFSHPGEGTRFQLSLPLCDHACQPPADQGILSLDIADGYLMEAVELSARRLGWTPGDRVQARSSISDAGGPGRIQLTHGDETAPGNVGLVLPFTPLRLSRALQESIQGTTEFLIPIVRQTLAGHRILLVEDEPLSRMVARQILEQAGAEIVEAEDGQQALDLLQENPRFSAVLMDLHMPVLGGIEATRRIRQGIRPSLRILALTAGSTEEERQECERAGMDGFLTKPFEAEHLISLLSESEAA
jgi:CheY-like chemotaxis protein